jgi:hypothetical protein
MIEKITQSFIKDMRSYLEGSLCGNIIRERWVNNRLLDDPDKEPGSMELGTYFEFVLTGAVPKNGKVPLPVYMKSKVKKGTVGLGIDDMYTDYRNAHKAAVLTKEYITSFGLKIVKAGVKMERNGYEGTIDIICEVVELKEGFTWNIGDEIIIDTKYSGLVEDGFKNWKNKHGWNWSPIQAKNHGTQAKHYHYISVLPFFFLVVQALKEEWKNLPIVKFFSIPFDDKMIADHVSEGDELFLTFKAYASTVGFTPRPSLSVCTKCPLFSECTDKHTYPRPQVIDLNGIE